MRRLVVIVCVGALGLLGGCSGGDDDGPDETASETDRGGGGVDRAAAVVGLSETLASVDVFAEERPALDRCPLGEVDPVVDDLASALETELDLSDRADEAFPIAEGIPAGVSCTASSAAGGRITLRATYTYPGRDHEEVVAAIVDQSEVTIEGRADSQEGEVLSYCYVPREPDGPPEGCGADWVAAEHELVISLTVEELDADAVAVAEVLDDRLGALIEALAEAA